MKKQYLGFANTKSEALSNQRILKRKGIKSTIKKKSKKLYFVYKK